MPADNIKYSISSGDGAKKAFLNLLEQEEAWRDNYSIKSPFLECKRYKIVSTDHFLSKDSALTFITSNMPFDMRSKSAGCVIINSDQKTQYLFFIQETT
jgi:hypothetical protein